MHHHVLRHPCGGHHQPPAEGHRAAGRARPPAGARVAHRDRFGARAHLRPEVPAGPREPLTGHSPVAALHQVAYLRRGVGRPGHGHGDASFLGAECHRRTRGVAHPEFHLAIEEWQRHAVEQGRRCLRHEHVGMPQQPALLRCHGAIHLGLRQPRGGRHPQPLGGERHAHVARPRIADEHVGHRATGEHDLGHARMVAQPPDGRGACAPRGACYCAPASRSTSPPGAPRPDLQEGLA